MIVVGENSQFFMYSIPVDMRKSIDGLSYLVCDLLAHNPQDGSVYIFHNKKCDKIKLLYWDKNGFILHYKRLEKHRFKFAKSLDESTISITKQQLSWLLAGLDFNLMEQFNELDFSDYY